HYNLATLLARVGQNETAQSHFRTAFELDHSLAVRELGPRSPSSPTVQAALQNDGSPAVGGQIAPSSRAEATVPVVAPDSALQIAPQSAIQPMTGRDHSVSSAGWNAEVRPLPPQVEDYFIPGIDVRKPRD
ncbi:MAG TPA: hypothetical protein VIY86_07970, partial [Pirellulaceae bacterium]